MADPHDVSTLAGALATNGVLVSSTPVPRPSTSRRLELIRPKQTKDPAESVHGMPPNFGDWSIPHVYTFQGILSSISKVYRPSDEALKHSFDNARFMRNDPTVMECVEQRQRSLALLDWHLEPDDADDPEQVALCDELKAIIEATPRFMQYRENLSHAVWYGRYAVAHKFAWKDVRGHRRIVVNRWKPVHGDKLVFRFDDGSHEHDDEQIGIRVSSHYSTDGKIADRWRVHDLASDGRDGGIGLTDRGLAYFLSPWERPLLAVHKHYIEDGEFDDPTNAGRIHGVGIRSRIYWVWYQKQELLAWLMEFLERSAFGMELWFYPWGNDEAREKMRTAAQERVGQGRNVVLVPKPLGDEGMAYGVEHMETGMAGADVVHKILTEYFGHLMKRYILGQTLTSEAGSTGLGSNLATVHLNTYQQIIEYDATNLEETLTTDLVQPLLRFNFARWADCPIRFRIDTEAADVEAKLNGWKTAWEMGVKLRSQDVMDLIGASVPDEGDEVLDKAGQEQAAAQAAMPPPGMGPPGAPPGPPGGPPPGGPPGPPLAPGSPEAQVYGAVQADQDTRRMESALGLQQPADRTRLADVAPDATTSQLPTDAQQMASALPHPSGFDPESLGKGLAAELQRVPDAALALKVAQKNLELNPEHYGRPGLRTAIEDAAAETHADPSKAQKDAGNFRKWLARGETAKPLHEQVHPERYGKKPAAGQRSLWDEGDHPREPKGATGGHGGEFAPAEGGASAPSTAAEDEGPEYGGGPATALEPAIEAGLAALAEHDLRERSGMEAAQAAVRAIAKQHSVSANDLWRDLVYQPFGMSRDIENPADEDALPAQRWGSGLRAEQEAEEEAEEAAARAVSADNRPVRADNGPPEERSKHASYVALMTEHGQPARPFDEWVKGYRERQGRVAERSNTEQPDNRTAERPASDEPDDVSGERSESNDEQADAPGDDDPPELPEAAFADEQPDTPRGEAEQARREDDPDYEFARKSEVPNAGEDLKHSARHKANAWRGLEEAERDGTAGDYMTRAMLQKIEPHGLAAIIEQKPEHVLTAVAMHLALQRFPPTPNYGRRPDASAEGMRKKREQYLAAWKRLTSKAEELALAHSNPQEALRELGRSAVSVIGALREKDRYSEVANSLVAFQGGAHKRGWKATTAFQQAFFDKYGHDETDENSAALKRHAGEVVTGKSVAASFGGAAATKGDSKPRFDPAAAYVTHASRKGGKEAPSSSATETTEYLTSDLGMRGVQFGNSVSDDERQHHLTKTAEALLDLADMVGLPLSAMSGDGKLGIAFGARGHGRALAHYEPGDQIINLTRKGGVGSLAHEWGHFFDHWTASFSLKTDRRGRAATEYGSEQQPDPKSTEPLAQAFTGLRKQLKDSGFEERCRQEWRSMEREGLVSERSYAYWMSVREMFARCFERHVQDKLAREGRENTYLVGLRKRGGGLWPTVEESSRMSAAFEKVFDVWRERQYPGKDRYAFRGENDRYRRQLAAGDGASLASLFTAEFSGRWPSAVERYAKPQEGQIIQRRGRSYIFHDHRWHTYDPQQANPRGKPLGSHLSMQELVRGALSNRGSASRMSHVYRDVDDQQAAAIREATNLDVRGYAHSVDGGAVLHILDGHGPGHTAAGEVPVTPGDFDSLHRIVQRPDSIESAGLSRDGLPMIRLTKRVNGALHILEVVRTGRRQLALRAMYKVGS